MPTIQSVEDEAKAKWGSWRKFIAAHPLTGCWISFAAGAVFIIAVRHFLA